MILGAGYTQMPLYEVARKLGIRTIAASIPGRYPGFACADESVFVDIADPEAVTDAVREKNVDGVVTCGMDFAMRAIGAACEAQRLPGPTREAAEKGSNKYEMKKALTAAGVQTAKFYCIHNKKELEAAMDRLPFPLIVKAVDLMGSRGIFRSNTREEARENFCKSMEVTRKDYCLIEEFIEGELFGAEAMVQNGRILFMLPNNTEVFVSKTPTPVGHSVPFRELDVLGKQIEKQTELALRAIGLDNCPLNYDLIKKDGKVYVIELAGRSGATGLPEMTGIYYGLNYYEMIIRLSLGEDVSSYFAKSLSRTPNLTHTIISVRQGVVRNIVNDNRMDEDSIKFSFNIEPGDEVRPYTNGRDRIGQVIIKGESLEQCEKRLEEILRNLHLELRGDLSLIQTPIQIMEEYREDSNQIYIKREDLLPFSFGGNKVRFAEAFLKDMERKHCDAMLMYGGYHSNLCRILAAACARRGIPCSMIHNVDDVDPKEISCNMHLIKASGVREYRCRKGEIAPLVQDALNDFREEGYNPYYIYGNIYGYGNVTVPMESYVAVYQEILQQERELACHFDYIFLASSTNTTQSGLLAGHLLVRDARKIVGISVTRSSKRAVRVIQRNLQEYQNKRGINFPTFTESLILVEDKYLAGAYSRWHEKIMDVIQSVYKTEGIGLDPIYTGKAFWGMLEYLKEKKITGKKILFLHTGGTPLFFDILPAFNNH